MMVHTVLRLENHELVTPVRERTARFASSPACDKWAVNPCLAAMVVVVVLVVVVNDAAQCV